MPPKKESLGPCPKCGAHKVLRSRRKGLKENLLKLFSKEIRFYRCHACGTRYTVNSDKPALAMNLRKLENE